MIPKEAEASGLDRTPFSKPREVQINLSNLQYALLIRSPQEELEASPDGMYFEREFIEKMLQAIETDDVVWDIGAGIGTHAIPAAIKAQENGHVHAFEPDEERAKGLELNIELNNLHSISVQRTALWGRNDTPIILHTNGLSGTAPKVREEELDDPNLQYRITMQGRSMTSLVESKEMLPPNVIKIDVEGAGMNVLRGMGELQPRHIFMEIHPHQLYPESDEDRDEIVDLLKNKGYKLETEDQRDGQIHCHFSLASM